MIAELTNHLWQSTLFAGVAALLAAALRQNRAHVRYWLWFAASIKFLVPFAVLIALGSRLPWPAVVTQIASAAIPGASLALERIAQPFSGAFVSAPVPPASADWALILILSIWTCGFATIALARVAGWRRIRAAVRTSKPWTTLHARVPIRSSPVLLEPGVVGVWRSVLLLPAGIEGRLTALQLEAVLAHEACHVRRRDNLTAAIHMLVEAVFWFHPLVWWIGARLENERERACDEHVLETLGDPQTYAEGILNVCKLYVESPLACVPGVTGSHVKKRIEDIMINRVGLELNVARKAVLTVVAAGALVTPVVVGMTIWPVQAHSVSTTTPDGQQPRTLDPSALTATKEVMLKYALFQMREAIDKYHTDNNQYPVSMESLMSGGYLNQIPTDPFTNRHDSWQLVPAKADANNPAAAAQGIHDVKSGSDAMAMDGTKYSDW